MSIGDITDYCLSKDNVEESFPFGEDTLVFKVSGKIFLLLALNSDPLQFNVKCDPVRALQLREQFDCVLPGYHMNKKHWNTVILDGSLDRRSVRDMIDHSYQLVAGSSSRKAK